MEMGSVRKRWRRKKIGSKYNINLMTILAMAAEDLYKQFIMLYNTN